MIGWPFLTDCPSGTSTLLTTPLSVKAISAWRIGSRRPSAMILLLVTTVGAISGVTAAGLPAEEQAARSKPARINSQRVFMFILKFLPFGRAKLDIYILYSK